MASTFLVCFRLPHSPEAAADLKVRSVAIKRKPRFADFDLMPLKWGAHSSPWVAAMAKAYPWLEKVYLKRMAVNPSPASKSKSLYPAKGLGQVDLTQLPADVDS